MLRDASALKLMRKNMGLGDTLEVLPVANGGTGVSDGLRALKSLGYTVVDDIKGSENKGAADGFLVSPRALAAFTPSRKGGTAYLDTADVKPAGTDVPIGSVQLIGDALSFGGGALKARRDATLMAEWTIKLYGQSYSGSYVNVKSVLLDAMAGGRRVALMSTKAMDGLADGAEATVSGSATIGTVRAGERISFSMSMSRSQDTVRVTDGSAVHIYTV